MTMGDEGDLHSFKALADRKDEVTEQNMIAASWIDDLGNPQKEMDEKNVFFNNETLLENGKMKDHFSKEHRSFFFEKLVEFQCKKGRSNPEN